GKTTFALSIAEGSAAAGKDVLLIDLDLQINASLTLFSGKGDDMLPWRHQRTIEDYLEARRRNVPAHVMTFVDQSNDVDLLSGSPAITLFERRVLVSCGAVAEARLSFMAWMLDILEEAKHHYELIVCDCPPGLSLISEAALASADLIVVPQVPDRL